MNEAIQRGKPSSDDPRRCRARRTDGQPCERWAIAGGTVCPAHGGSSGHVRRAARLRLLDQVDPAITTLVKIMNNPEVKEADRIRAAENILDRAGYPRQVELTGEDVVELVKYRISQLTSTADDGRDLPDLIEGEVVEDETEDQDQEKP